MNKQDINCLMEYKRTINSDGSYEPINYYEILKNVYRVINIYNNGIVFKINDEHIKMIKIFEEMGYRLKKNSLETMKLGSSFIFCDELDTGMPESIGFVRRDINENLENSEFCITVDFDKKSIQIPLFLAIDKDDFKKNFKKDDDWDYDYLDVIDFDPDNVKFNELDEIIEFIRKHLTKEFKIYGCMNKVIFLNKNF
jgi:hypothetical protein